MNDFITEEVINAANENNLIITCEDVIDDDYIFTIVGGNDSVKMLVNKQGFYLEIFPIDEMNDIQTLEFSSLIDCINAFKVYELYRTQVIMPTIREL